LSKWPGNNQGNNDSVYLDYVSASTRSSQVDVRVYGNVRPKDILCRAYIEVEKEREKDGDAFINRGDREREEER